jgi:hypothetical protein
LAVIDFGRPGSLAWAASFFSAGRRVLGSRC